MVASLLIRPGTRYECHGDGTCCTSVHQLGPITQAEASRVRASASRIFPNRTQPAVGWHEGIKGLVIAPDGERCMFLDERARCRLHALEGLGAKPAACRQFPLGTTATPAGVRVTLSHRCPCVTVGRNPLLDERRARAILASPGSGRIIPASRVETPLRLRGKRSIDMHAYAAWEKPFLERLDRDDGESIESILRIGSGGRLPRLEGTSWTDVSRGLVRDCQRRAYDEGFTAVVRWVEHALQPGSSRVPPRPWAWTFGRAAERAAGGRPLRRVYGAWLADELWGLSWAAERPLYKALADMAARYLIAQRIAERLHDTGTHPALAAAEGIMVVDLLGASEPWAKTVRRIEEPAAGAFDRP